MGQCLWNVPSGNPRKNKPSAQQQFKRQLANKSQYVFSAPDYNLPRGGYLLWRNGVKLTQNIPLPTCREEWRRRPAPCSANNAARAAVLWLRIQFKYGQMCACVRADQCRDLWAAKGIMWDSLCGISSFEVGINGLGEGHGNGQSILGCQGHRAGTARCPWEGQEAQSRTVCCWRSCIVRAARATAHRSRTFHRAEVIFFLQWQGERLVTETEQRKTSVVFFCLFLFNINQGPKLCQIRLTVVVLKDKWIKN